MNEHQSHKPRLAAGVSASLNSTAPRTGPSPVGVRKGPQPFLNITPLQKRQSAGWKQSVLRQKRPEDLSKNILSHHFEDRLYHVSIPFVARGVSGAVAQREAHCLTAWPLYAFGHIWRHRQLRGYNPCELAGVTEPPPTGSYWTPCLVTMSCLDVMYHQSYGAHYLPAAAYKATCYNYHHQQQQVRHSSSFFQRLTLCICFHLSRVQNASWQKCQWILWKGKIWQIEK